MYTEFKRQKHFERASKFHGSTINGVEYVNRKTALKMAEMMAPTFNKRCKEFGITTLLQANGRKLYGRDSLLSAIERGHFGKFITYNRKK